MAAADYYDDVQKVYIAYYGRPADREGLLFWADKLNTANGNLSEIINAFGTSAEAEALFGGQTVEQMVSAIYEQLFNRLPDPEGLDFYSQGIMTGKFTLASVMLDVLNGAKNADVAIIDAKLAAADAFTDSFFDGLHDAEDVLAYSGDANAAIARDWLHDVVDTATATTAEAAIADTIADMTGNINGETFTLTASIDEVAITGLNSIDTVKGVIAYDGTDDTSTLSVGDTITGNGHTILQVAVADINAGAYSTPFVDISGIEQLKIVNGDSGTLTVDGSSLGSDLDSVSLSGKGGLDLVVDDLALDKDNISVTIAGATTGTVTLDGTGSTGAFTLGDLNAYVEVQNNTKGTTDAAVTLGVDGIDVNLGKDAFASLALSHSKTSTAAAATVGDINIAHININVATDASAEYVTVYNYASASDNNATAGSITIGDVSMTGKSGADACVFITDNAYVCAGTGNATVGDITIGNVTVSLTDAKSMSADNFYICVSNSAYAAGANGAATAGDLTVGDITLSGHGSIYAEFSNSADATGEGDATAGALTLGNISMMNNTTDYYQTVYAYNFAWAETGNATVGNVSIGDVSMSASYYACLSVEACATVANTGDAMVGAVTVGNIALKAYETGTNYLCLEQTAEVKATAGEAGGEASVGNVVIGNIDMQVASSSNYMYLYQYATAAGSKTHDATVGDLTIGDVSMSQLPGDGNSTNELYIYREASAVIGNATAGDVVLGNIDFNQVAGVTQTAANNCVTVYNYANAATGNATVGNITVGDITSITDAGDAYVYLYNCASGSAGEDASGMVSVGNVDMQAYGDAYLGLDVYNYAISGTAGGIDIGNVSMVATKATGHASLYLYQSGDAVQGVSVGNVTMTAGTLDLNIYNCASDGNTGSISVGNITLNGSDANNTIQNYAGAGNTGSITVGDVSLTAGKGQNNVLQLDNTASSAVGTITVGDVSLHVTASKSAATADVGFGVYTDGGKATGGNIVVGDITIAAKGASTKVSAVASSFADGYVNVTSTDGTVTVGNITVTGGVVTKDSKVDGFDDLAGWLSLSAKNDAITIGNVDYSGYAGKGYATNLIDVSGYSGAAVIKGATAGSTITDNGDTNAITLDAATKVDKVILSEAQDWIANSTTTGGSGLGDLAVTQADVDSISGFATGDILTTSTGVGGDGDLIQNGSSLTWAQFLTNAENQIDNLGNSGYTAIVGGDTYVALAGVDNVVETIVKVTGVVTFSFDGTDLVFAA